MEGEMPRLMPALFACALCVLALPARAQTPPFATTKVDGTENVYMFRYGGHQAMFVVTSDGVIATDPIGYLRPQAVKTYIDEIRKVTQAPIRYVVYSHHHFDHIAGGQPFKDLGATFVAHARAKQHLIEVNYPDVVLPDLTVDDSGGRLTLGDTTLELIYVGRNHSDNMLLMRLPKQRLIFTVDYVPIEAVLFRDVPDAWPIEWEDSLNRTLALDWDRMLTGHPYRGRLGTKQDVKNLLGYMQDLSDAAKHAADAGKCPDAAMKEIKLDKYKDWLSYNEYLPGNIERYCYYWSRGY
jgi:glyoxylase-like metal-dependent hydrolase (beta-lactamase superfamily II)